MADDFGTIFNDIIGENKTVTTTTEQKPTSNVGFYVVVGLVSLAVIGVIFYFIKRSKNAKKGAAPAVE